MQTLEIQTHADSCFVDITEKIQAMVKLSRIQEGICVVFIPHTTAAITVNENTDPDVLRDILKELNHIVPIDNNYRHSEGNSAAHIKSGLFGNSLHLIISDGNLVLGRWQGVYLCEFDGPRHRNVHIQLVSS